MLETVESDTDEVGQDDEDEEEEDEEEEDEESGSSSSQDFDENFDSQEFYGDFHFRDIDKLFYTFYEWKRVDFFFFEKLGVF